MIICITQSCLSYYITNLACSASEALAALYSIYPAIK